MATPGDLAAFDAAFNDTADEIDAAHDGPYANELQDLLQLSGQAVTDGTAAVTPMKTYNQLIALLQQASATNLSEAALKDRIEQLGGAAVAIAKNVAGLARLLT